ncbi:hypothetical protein BJ741DRAFT_627007 [Chytriomyces cf. hyalinus JEL632]|nr:hypothetical protein BJ741DRAFT_627007 [Chytriomyces cf. hyalinus JEL632]
MLVLTVALTVLSGTAFGQLTRPGCTALQTTVAAFGFVISPAAVPGQFAGCGCAFGVAGTDAQNLDATCAADPDDESVWSVVALTISGPPAPLSALPSPLARSGAPSVAFTRLTSLALTNNAITGAALSRVDLLPNRLQALDISNNPNLAPFPARDASNETSLNFSFSTVNMAGNSQMCCPVSLLTNEIIECTPVAPACTGVTSSTSTSLATSTSAIAAATTNTRAVSVKPPVAGGAPIPTGDSNNSGSGLNASQDTSDSGFPVGASVSIALGAVMVVGALLLGGYAHAVRSRQKPVVFNTDGQEALWRSGNASTFEGVSNASSSETAGFVVSKV